MEMESLDVESTFDPPPRFRELRHSPKFKSVSELN